MSASPFDDMADHYDAEFTDTVVARTLREMVWNRMAETFTGGERILELGCGTGEDAIELTRLGIRVLATDGSSRMIAVAKAKAQRSGIGDAIDFRTLTIETTPQAVQHELFDGIFSNFGALNCVTDLMSVTATLAPLLRPGGKILWVIMGRHVPWEWLWYLLRGNWVKARRRLRKNGVDWRGIQIHYPTPTVVGKVLDPYFETIRFTPLGWALPPSYAAPWVTRHPYVLRQLTQIEKKLHRVAWLSSYSDHYLIQATRKAG